MAVAQLLLSMEPKYICHNQCTMDTSSPIVPKLSTEILLIPAILELYHIPPLNLLIFESSRKFLIDEIESSASVEIDRLASSLSW